MEHNIYSDATLTGAAFTIAKLTAKKLTFDKLQIPYQKVVSEAAILQQVKGTKNGYTLKNISEISGISEITGTNIAEFTGTPKAVLHIKKTGSFSAKITLTHPLYKDVEITGAQFEITPKKASPQTLTFKRLVVSKNLITEADILRRITELSGASLENGYTLKALTGLQAVSGGPGLVELSGLSIKIKKTAGIFTADLVLTHPEYLDVTLTGATFEKKEQVFVFDEKTQTITGVTAKYATIFKTATEVTFPDEIDGVQVEVIKGRLGNNISYNVFGASTNQYKIKTIHLPKNLKTVGAYAFASLRKLTAINLPPSVTTVGKSAFGTCLLLSSVTMPAVTTIEENGFISCAISSVNMPAVKTIGNDAFRGTLALTSVTMPAVKTIGNSAFRDCQNLTSVTMPVVKTIGNAAFNSCRSLTSVELPAIVTINITAFNFCMGLTSITIGKSIKTFEKAAFAYARHAVVTLKQPDPNEITKVDKTSLASVKRIEVPKNSVTAYRTHSNWSRWASKIFAMSARKLSFKRLTVSNKTLITKEDITKRIADKKGYTLKAISGLQAVSGGPGLVELSGDSHLSIAIKKAAGIFTADLVFEHPEYLDTTITGATFEKKEPVYVFDEKTGTISGVTAQYKTYFSTAASVTFPDEIDGVEVEVIQGFDPGGQSKNVFGVRASRNIKTIRLPKNLKIIGGVAFSGVGLTSLTIPKLVTSIGQNAFAGAKLTSLIIPDEVTTIGLGAFTQCRDLTSLTIGSKVTTIKRNAFAQCTNLLTTTIPLSVKTMEYESFAYCTKLTITFKHTHPSHITLSSGSLFGQVVGGLMPIKKIIVPKGASDAYKKSNLWSQYASIIEESTN